ncbi:SUMO1 sentrin specific peptidase 8 [Homalodisca vitripennis]|nr:SUMO1 sentrin specific peptidase 8 [Homalodisca vitripennis]
MVMTRSQYQCNALHDDSMEGLIINLSSQINSFTANYPDLDLNDLVSTIGLLMQRTDHLNSEIVSQREVLESSHCEIQSLKTKLEIQQELTAKEINNSFKIQDEVDEEVVSFKNKISNLEKRLQDYVTQCRDAESATNLALSDLKNARERNFQLSEKNINLSNAVALANSKIVVLSDKVACLESNTETSWNRNLWTDDNTLNSYFDAMSSSVTNKDEIIFLGPSQTHLLKLCDPVDAPAIFEQICPPMLKFAFCCLSNSVSPNQDSGSHWSLLFCDLEECKAFHFDSLAGSNALSAQTMAKVFNIGKDKVLEMPCFQQSNSFECGLNVLVNAKQILQFYCLDNSHLCKFEEWWGLRRHTRLTCPENESVPSVPSEQMSDSKKFVKNSQNKFQEKKVSENWTSVRSKKRGKRRVWLGTPNVVCRNRFQVLSTTVNNTVTEPSFGKNENVQACEVSDLQNNSNLRKRKTRNRKHLTRLNAGAAGCSWGVRDSMGTEVGSKKEKCNATDIVTPLETNNVVTTDQLSLKNVLVVGDSMIRHVGPGLLEKGAFLECYPGARIRDLKRVLLSYVSYSLDIIHIHVGTNDLGWGYRGGPGYNGGHGKREALHDMADLLFTAKTHFPNSKIYVNSIIIRSDIGYKALYDFNTQLDLMCNNFGVMFVEANCWVARRHLARDGRHLNRKGVARLASLFGAVIPAALRLMGRSAATTSQVDPLTLGLDPELSPLPSQEGGLGPASPGVSGNGLVRTCVLRI